MRPAKFQVHFTLRPLVEVEPWGAKHQQHLHWFGLSDGTYWFEADGHTLFRYSDLVLEEVFADATEPAVEYYVARLYEDLMEILPAVLEPIPADLAAFVSTWDKQIAWQRVWRKWLLRQPDIAIDHWLQAVGWWDERKLDTSYIPDGPQIWFWRTGDTVLIRWNSRRFHCNGFPLWADDRGQCEISAADFEAAVTSFHERFFAAMAQRVSDAVAAWPKPDVSLDLEQLQAEHQHRLTSFERALARPHATDWDAVRAVLRCTNPTP